MTGRHRGQVRDPIATVLQVVWMSGHIVVLGLLGAVADHQLTGDPLPEIAASARDAASPTPSL
ncbi:hypothetical protein ACIA8O_36860 [Kitasatospora sp. NPDC051853]|uniref:hypothetical protein n=1 Tax=Kitasatospora sp. NPDC051853 TaxID=3364058 RepID=UPI00379B9207